MIQVTINIGTVFRQVICMGRYLMDASSHTQKIPCSRNAVVLTAVSFVKDCFMLMDKLNSYFTLIKEWRVGK